MLTPTYGATDETSETASLVSSRIEPGHDIDIEAENIFVSFETEENVEESRDRLIGSVLMMVSALFFGLMTATISWGNTLGYSSFELLCYQGGIAIALTWICQFVPYSCSAYNPLANPDNDVTFDRTVLGWLVMRGLIAIFSILLTYNTISAIPTNDALATISLYPIAAAIFALIFFGERISILHIISLLLCVAGLVLIERPHLFFGGNDDISHYFGYIAGVTAALTYALSYVVIRQCQRIPFLWIVHSENTAAFLIGLIFSIRDGFSTISNDGKDIFMIAGAGFFGFGCQICFTKAAQLLSPGLASLLRVSDVIWIYIFQNVFFDHAPTLFNGFGAAIICTSIFVVTFDKMQ